jgi:hypothetical protein
VSHSLSRVQYFGYCRHETTAVDSNGGLRRSCGRGRRESCHFFANAGREVKAFHTGVHTGVHGQSYRASLQVRRRLRVCQEIRRRRRVERLAACARIPEKLTHGRREYGERIRGHNGAVVEATRGETRWIVARWIKPFESLLPRGYILYRYQSRTTIVKRHMRGSLSGGKPPCWSSC